jgi:peptide/nickel transport system substrate-binding protein
MHLRKFWLFAGAVLLALALTATGSAKVSGPTSQNAKDAGTIVFGAEQGGGPDWCLNQVLVNDCGEFWNSVFLTPVLRGVFMIQPNFTYKPDLISKFKLQQKPMRVTYYIKAKAKWSDGVPVTGKDIKFTWQTIMDPKIKDHVSTAGYDQIKSVTGSGKVVKLTFSKPYADWKDLFTSGFVLPVHALKGANMLNVWTDNIVNPKNGKPISNGPFLQTAFDRGSGITLTRNPAWWGSPKPKIDRIVFKFLTDTNTEIQQVRGGEVDAIYPQPQQALSELSGQAGLRIQSNLGTTWEHIDIQQGPKGNALAKNLWVRQALILSLDRASTVKALFGQLNPRLRPLNNAVFVTNHPAYKQNWAKWTYNRTKAENILKAHNCTKAADGIYRCGGTKLSFQFESTRGNKLRELSFTFFQDQAKKAGIELLNNFKPAGTFFGEDLPNANYDLALFAWVGSPDPAGSVEIWKCNGAQNYMSYCNRTVSRLLEASDVQLNVKKRFALFNQADARMANDIPTIPLYQKPTYFVFKAGIKGMKDNATLQGPTWNAEAWSR